MARTSITIVLELDPTADCPVGSAHVPAGIRRRFHGWLGLAEAIDTLAGGYARSDAASRSVRGNPSPDGPGARRSERSSWS